MSQNKEVEEWKNGTPLKFPDWFAHSGISGHAVILAQKEERITESETEKFQSG